MANFTPNIDAAGDETSIPSQYPATGSHWDKMADYDPDTCVYATGTTWYRDLYNMPSHTTETGVIDSVAISAMFKKSADCINTPLCKISLKSNGAVVDGTAFSVTSTAWMYGIGQSWATNPTTGIAWTWADIDALQPGISINANNGVTGTIYASTMILNIFYHVIVITSALTRVTGIVHYYKRADNIYRMSVNMGGIAPLMLASLMSKNPPNPLNPEVVAPAPSTGIAPPVATPASAPTPDYGGVIAPGFPGAPPNTAYPSFPNFVPPPVPPFVPGSNLAPMLPDYYFPGYDPLKPYPGGNGQNYSYPSSPDFVAPSVPPVIPTTGGNGYAPMLPDYYFKGYNSNKPYYGGGKQ